ncbi:MAG: hypothetical protein ACRBFS_18615 [Aureispira sp.]
MPSQDFRAELLILSQQLQTNPMVEVTELVLPPPLSLETLQQLCTASNFPTLPQDIQNTYAQLGGGHIHITWQCSLEKAGIEPYQQEEITQVQGQITLSSITTLGQTNPKVNKKKHYPNFEAEELVDIPYFRIIEAWNDVVNVGFLIDEASNSIENELYYTLYNADGFHLPSINFQTYLQQLFYYKGLSDWQHPYLLEQTERLDYYINKIFN